MVKVTKVKVIDVVPISRTLFKKGKLVLPQTRPEIQKQMAETRSKKRAESRRKNAEERERAIGVMPDYRFYVETDKEKVADKIISYARRKAGVIVHAVSSNYELKYLKPKMYKGNKEIIMMEFHADTEGGESLMNFLRKQDCKFDEY